MEAPLPRPQGQVQGAGNPPLDFFSPMSIVVWLTVFSPIIISLSILLLSLVVQNFKGFLYLGLLLLCSFLRSAGYRMMGVQPFNESQGQPDCRRVKYNSFGNNAFSTFVFAFTFMYICLPMFTSGYINYWIVVPLLVYWFLDIFIKLWRGCASAIDLFGNALLGASCSGMFVAAMYGTGVGSWLIFNEISSDKDICYQPNEQTFKCKVFKDGTLVGTI
jgi:hypothetical protein